MTAAGVVTRAAADGCVEVELAAPAACSGCEGACLWRRLARTQRATLATPLGLAAGERVVVALPARYVLHASLVVHGLPLAALLAGALAGFGIAGTDAGALAGAAAGIVLGAAASPRLRRRVEERTLRHLVVQPEMETHAATGSL